MECTPGLVRYVLFIFPITLKLKVTGKRLESGIKSFIRPYSPKRAFIVISEGKGGEVEVNGTRISFLNIVKLREVLEFLK